MGTEICTARLLGPAGRGQLSLCTTAISCGVLLGTLGQESPIVIWSADRTKDRADWLPAVFTWGIGGSVVASLLWSFFYWFHPIEAFHGITHGLAELVAVAIPMSALFAYFSAILMGLERFRVRALVTLTSQGLEFLTVVILFCFLSRRPEMALWASLVGMVGAMAVGLALQRAAFLWGHVRSIGRYLLPALKLGVRGQPGSLATFFNYRLDTFMVNYFLSPAQVGLYAVGVLVSEALWQIPHAAATALFPRTARTINDGATGFTCVIVRHVLLISCVSGLALAIVSPFLIPFVFGPHYASSVSVIYWILPGTVALSAGKVMASDLTARGRAEFSSVFALIALAVTIVLDLVLVPRMGIIGAALASSTAYFVDAALIAIALKHLLKITWRSFLLPTKSEFAAYWQLARKVGGLIRSSLELAGDCPD